MWDLILSVPDHCLSFYFVNELTFHPRWSLDMFVLCNWLCNVVTVV